MLVLTKYYSDIMKLTALFTARQGHSFLANLSVKESRNYQFDFLKPTHSLFGYFNRLIEQYTKVLMPTPETLEKLKERSKNGAKWKMLAEAQAHAKWERTRREQEKKREDDREAERGMWKADTQRQEVRLTFRLRVVAFAEIDWHDYAIVQTIEFTAADASAELPPPMSVQEVENMTLAQKRMAAMVMETTVEDVEAHRARQAAAEAEAAAAVSSAGGGAAVEAADDDVMMEESDDEDTDASERKKKEEEERQKELERARAIQASSLEAGAPMKIRTDYVPKREYYFLHNRVPILTDSKWAVRTRWRCLHVQFAANKFLPTNCKNICELSFSTHGGNHSATLWKPGRLRHRSYSEGRMLYPRSRTSRELVWIFSAQRQTKRDESGRRRKSASAGRREKRLFGMVIPRRKLAHSTNIRQTSISTNRLPPSTAPKGWGRTLSPVV